jgi:hypothetical protein
LKTSMAASFAGFLLPCRGHGGDMETGGFLGVRAPNLTRHYTALLHTEGILE